MNLDDWVEEEEVRIAEDIDNGIITPEEGRKEFKRLYREARDYEEEELQRIYYNMIGRIR